MDTSWRPKLQHFVVTNVMNQTGWPVQIFHGPTNGPQLRHLFAAQIGTKVAMAKGRAARPSLTLTDLGDDYMEDWVRLSSMMLLDVFWRATLGEKVRLGVGLGLGLVFWRATLGEKVLVFQPDTIMLTLTPTPTLTLTPNQPALLPPSLEPGAFT